MRNLLIISLLVFSIILMPFVYADSSFIQPTDTETKSLQIEAHTDDGKASVGTDFRYNKDALIVLKKDGKPKAAIIGKFGQSNVDLSGLVVRTDEKKTLVKLEKPNGVGSLTAKTDPNFAIFVPNKNGGAGVYVCSGAKTVEEITENCACKIEIRGPLPLASSASVYTINGITAFLTDDKQNYVIYGLTGTGVDLLELESVGTLTNLNLWDDTDSQRKGVNEDVGFYAEYVNSQSLLLIQNADCRISLPNNQSGRMVWNAAKKRYEFSSKFSQSGEFIWGAACTDPSQNNNPASKTDDLVISSASDEKPRITLIKPNQTEAINSNTVGFACSAVDDQKIVSMSLYIDNMTKPFLTKTFSGKSGLLTVDVNGVPQGEHKWTCDGTDSALQKTKATERSFFVVTAAPLLQCKQDWSCDSWSPCIEGRQIRSCTDRNSCFSQSAKPDQEQSCDATLLPGTIRASTPKAPSAGPTDLSPVYSLLVTVLILIWLLFLFYKRRKKRKT